MKHPLPAYAQIRNAADLSKGQYKSREIVPCEACGIFDEAKRMVWTQDSYDAFLGDPDWRLNLWRQRRPAEFQVFYYCQRCNDALVNG